MQRIGFIVFPGFQIMSSPRFGVRVRQFETGEPVYDIRMLSETGGTVRSSIGMTSRPSRSTRRFDTLLVGGGTWPARRRRADQVLRKA